MDRVALKYLNLTERNSVNDPIESNNLLPNNMPKNNLEGCLIYI